MPRYLMAIQLVSSILRSTHTPSIAPLAAPLANIAQTRSASILSSLSDIKGAYNKRIRRGRGPASGKGKTSGRGQKGQKAHGKVPRGFEGGQTPLRITNPPRGKNKHNAFKVDMSPVNLDRIQSWINQGRLNPKLPITMRELRTSRCIHGVKRHGVKVLGRNAEQLTSPIHIVVSRASTTAIARIEALGGTVTTRFYSPTSIKRVLRGDTHPTLSLQSHPSHIAQYTSESDILRSRAFQTLQAAYANLETTTPPPPEAKNEALLAVMNKVNQRYKYRLPDATSRSDIEYYRDPAHRGYLAHTVKEGESPSLFFKLPGAVRDRKEQNKRRAAARATADNRIF